MFDRRQLEQLEDQRLAVYALRSRDSRGRLYAEDEPDYRTAFQRDRDRIVHSAAFRRLEYKTQVFVSDTGDYYRTRLTHTLEVAQIGRTLARALGVNEDLVETICLAHDLGHPPFGHAGEGVLNMLMADHGGFNHNVQSYRVVTELERRYPRWPGLNLTRESLEGIAWHEGGDRARYPSLDDRESPGLRGSLEAQAAHLADELAYNAHDLDDGLQAGLLLPAQLDALEIWRALCDQLGWHGGELDEVTRHRFIRALIGLQVDDVLATTAANLARLRPAGPQAIQTCAEPLVAHSPYMAAQTQALKTFLYEHMYYHYRVIRMSTRAERFMAALFQSYLDEPRQLPTEYRAQIEALGPHRAIADYLAGLTDRSALLEYRHLFDPLTRP